MYKYYINSIRLLLAAVLSVCVLGSAVLADDASSEPVPQETASQETVLPNAPPPPEAIDNTSIPHEPSSVSEPPQAETLQPHAEMITAPDSQAAEKGALETPAVLLIGGGIGLCIMAIGIAGGRGRKR